MDSWGCFRCDQHHRIHHGRLCFCSSGGRPHKVMPSGGGGCLQEEAAPQNQSEQANHKSRESCGTMAVVPCMCLYALSDSSCYPWNVSGVTARSWKFDTFQSKN